MDCSFLGSDKTMDKIFSSCPTPLQALTNPEKAYCCPTRDATSWECCDLATFVSTPPIDSLILTALVILFITTACVLSCCICCCCAYSKRRQRGRVLQNQGIRFY
ncbi:hypothetical protein GE061_008382 [Apolygus lucorum]|uniref:Uncharacterized protein n=1 Tax=Apolygus lucorum TaxID=248454 RepID=A0A6A4ITT0_APOLU|nr:hypothetical protein GE061_008382 [Apolygus lucorum]